MEQSLHRQPPGFPLPLWPFLYHWRNIVTYVGKWLPSSCSPEHIFTRVPFLLFSFRPLTELGQTTHPDAGSLRRHFETDTLGSEMGRGKGKPTFRASFGVSSGDTWQVAHRMYITAKCPKYPAIKTPKRSQLRHWQWLLKSVKFWAWESLRGTWEWRQITVCCRRRSQSI